MSKGENGQGRSRPIWLLPAISGVAALLGVFALLAVLDTRGGGQGEVTAGAGGAPIRVSGQAEVGGPFELVAHTGETVTEQDFLGRPMLVYFGFTYCPDICPMSLQILDAALAQLPAEDAARFQTLLISVDPERDTPEALAQYVDTPAFPDGLVGLTGTPGQIRAAADAYRVYYARIEDDRSTAGYTMDHTSVIYLMDSKGELVDVFTHGAAPDTIAARLKRFLEEGGAGS